tara:strand:+ start:102 stop:317 length:216 start_codon:yes stop_codon:yes gene_type:complete
MSPDDFTGYFEKVKDDLHLLRRDDLPRVLEPPCEVTGMRWEIESALIIMQCYHRAPQAKKYFRGYRDRFAG